MSSEYQDYLNANFGPEDTPATEVVAECDCCGERRVLSRNWLLGYIETFACDECRGA